MTLGDRGGPGSEGGHPPGSLLGALAGVLEVLAVVAHPDDESFGLGAVLSTLADSGRRVQLLCLTHGEASTVGAAADLAQVRAAELASAANRLGVAEATLLDYPDGGLAGIGPRVLAGEVRARVGSADALVVLDSSGVTGHPDHQAATAAALNVAAERGLLVLEWGVPERVAASLRAEFSVPITGLAGEDAPVALAVDRDRQRAAIACHVSQDPANPLLARRLQLSGDEEWLRLQPAPYPSRLAAFVGRISPLVVPEPTDTGRREVLDRLVGFASSAPLPPPLAEPGDGGSYGVHCLHEDAAGWTLAAVVTTKGGCTPPHDHLGWGAAATVAGVERNRRFHGTCPTQLRLRDEQLAPAGGGYLFGSGEIHQACDATGVRTVSLHLLAPGDPQARQHCAEPERP